MKAFESIASRRQDRNFSRRRVLSVAAAGAGLGAITVCFPARAALSPTPRQTAGPFYPPDLPLDDDNDLVRVDGQAAAALGTVTHVGGRLLDLNGRAIDGARIEIWQCDANGRYLHPADRGGPRDAGFQGFGHAMTDGAGAYRFRTIRPVAYTGRTPHIHFAVRVPGGDPFVTQMYVAGDPGNAGDFLYNRLDPAARALVTVELAPAPELEADALAGTFDIVLESDS